MEFKELTELVQGAVSKMHSAVERQDEEIKKFGAASGGYAKAIEDANKEITALQEIQVKYQRQTVPVPGSPEPKSEEEKAHSAAFYKWVRHGETALNPDERKALVEDSTGQYLITPELETEIERTLPKITIIRPMAKIRPISKDRLMVRSLTEVSVGWGKLETGAEIPESSLTPGAPAYHYAEDLYGLAKIGEDELADSDFNLAALLAESFTRAIGEAEDLAFVRGAGHGSLQPEGICINTTLTGNTVDTAGSNAVTFERFMQVVYQCPSQYRRNGAWVVNSSTELALRQLRSKTSATWQGPFLWQPSLVLGAPNTFLGYPIYNQDDMKELTDSAQVIAIFGDFKAGYRIIDRAGITLQRLVELYSEAGLVGFKIHKRVGGGLIKPASQPLVLLTEA